MDMIHREHELNLKSSIYLHSAPINRFRVFLGHSNTYSSEENYTVIPELN